MTPISPKSVYFSTFPLLSEDPFRSWPSTEKFLKKALKSNQLISIQH